VTPKCRAVGLTTEVVSPNPEPKPLVLVQVRALTSPSFPCIVPAVLKSRCDLPTEVGEAAASPLAMRKSHRVQSRPVHSLPRVPVFSPPSLSSSEEGSRVVRREVGRSCPSSSLCVHLLRAAPKSFLKKGPSRNLSCRLLPKELPRAAPKGCPLDHVAVSCRALLRLALPKDRVCVQAELSTSAQAARVTRPRPCPEGRLAAGHPLASADWSRPAASPQGTKLPLPVPAVRIMISANGEESSPEGTLLRASPRRATRHDDDDLVASLP
jgi:hypothetical protein